MERRPKLSVPEQVQHMKNNGIRFDLITEKDAEEYLTNNTYFFKLKAYDVLFEKYRIGEKQGQYVNLDFAYLQELSIIDMHLRHFLLKTTVDLEHVIKVRFLRDFNNSESDGYGVVDQFMTTFPDIKDRILQKRGSSYCDDLIDKLESEGYALWNIIELLSFGDFIKLYEFFYETYPNALTGINFSYPMRNIKNLRNASAHNNCLIDQIAKESNRSINPNKKVISYVSLIPGMQKQTRLSCMKKPTVCDFVTLIYVIDKAIEPGGVRNHIIEELQYLFTERIPRHGDYFVKNNTLTMIYGFIKQIVDNLK